MQSRVLATGSLLLALFVSGCRAPTMQLKQPVAVTGSVTNRTFRDSLAGAIRTPFFPGNHVTPLVNGDQFVPAMIAAIRSATNSINFETFIVNKIGILHTSHI